MGTFRGYFITSANGVFPEKYINWDSYKSTPNSVSELNSYVNSNNELIRKVAKNTRSKIEFSTRAINDVELEEIWTWLRSNMTVAAEKKLSVILWNEQDHTYKSYLVYVPDITYTAKRHDENHIYYDSVRFAFITYGEGTEVT